VKPTAKLGRLAWRIGLCVVLLGWVFHAIFLAEGHRAWEAAGRDWDMLPRAEQWRLGWTHGPRELWDTLRLLQPVAGLVSVVFMGLTIALGVVRWRMVLAVQGIKLSPGRAGEISLVAHFFNSFLLGSTGGDLMKAYYAARETQHLKAEAVVTVIGDRLIGLLAMLLFAAVVLVPNYQLVAANHRLWALAVVVLAMLAAGLVVMGLSFRGGLSRRWPQARGWLRRLPKAEALERALDACRRFGQDQGFIGRTFAVSMVLNVACVLQYWTLARGLNLAIPLPVLFAIVPIIICISALPITPSGLGVRENLYVWILAVPGIGVPATKALSLSLLAYAGSLLWSIVGGVVYVLFKGRHHLKEIAAADPPAEDAA
jgi:uncharacterized protein (TIRG00374 family)